MPVRASEHARTGMVKESKGNVRVPILCPYPVPSLAHTLPVPALYRPRTGYPVPYRTEPCPYFARTSPVPNSPSVFVFSNDGRKGKPLFMTSHFVVCVYFPTHCYQICEYGEHIALLQKRTQFWVSFVSSKQQGVKSKETVGNSWTVLKVILGHKYHHNH